MDRQTSLRAIQRDLCKHFHQRFPAMKAILKHGNEKYDEFSDLPFKHCREGAVLDVSFEKTDDPYLYDLADRVGPKMTFEEEIVYDAAMSTGKTVSIEAAPPWSR